MLKKFNKRMQYYIFLIIFQTDEKGMRFLIFILAIYSCIDGSAINVIKRRKT
jgi:hypothetical protein